MVYDREAAEDREEEVNDATEGRGAHRMRRVLEPILKEFEEYTVKHRVTFNMYEERQNLDSLMQVLPLFKKAMGSNKEESADKDQKYTEKELRWIFDELDVLRTGQLRAESLSKVLERVGFAVTPKQAHRLVQEARGSADYDQTGSDFITVDHFIHFVQRKFAQQAESSLKKKQREYCARKFGPKTRARYKKMSWFCARVVTHRLFDPFICLCIMAVGVASAISLSYDDPEAKPMAQEHSKTGNPLPHEAARYLFVMQYLSLVVFTTEMVTKIIACGEQPLTYLTDPEEGSFNAFDAAIVVFSLGFFFTEGGGSTLAVGRLLRLVKVVLKVPQLRFVLLGFVAGIRAVFPIMGLLLLIIYLYAIMGRLVFGENDRAHFGSMGPTMLTLFQAATLSAWGDMWAVNEYGCDRFDSFGQYTMTNTTHWLRTDFGKFEAWDCISPMSWPITANLYFYSFTLLTAFVVLSLFISVITTAMFEVMESKRFETKRLVELRALRHGKTRVATELGDEASPLRLALVTSFEPDSSDDEDEPDDVPFNDDDAVASPTKPVDRSARSSSPHKMTAAHRAEARRANWPVRAAKFANKLAKSNQFEGLVACAIMAVGALEWLTIDDLGSPQGRRLADKGILFFFTVEIAIKVLAESDVPKPPEWRHGKHIPQAPTFIDWGYIEEWSEEAIVFSSHYPEGDFVVVIGLVSLRRYLSDSWNKFDVFVVLLSYVDIIFPLHSVKALRMLRMFRIIRLLHSFPSLRAVVESLMVAFQNVVYLLFLIVLINFISAAAGMLMFRENDPHNFGTLPAAMISVWMVETFDNWEDIMQINMFGCMAYGYGEGTMSNPCTAHGNRALGWIAATYFVLVVVLGGLVMPTVLIGIVSVAFDDQTRLVRLENRQSKMTSDLVIRSSYRFMLTSDRDEIDAHGTLDEFGEGEEDDALEEMSKKHCELLFTNKQLDALKKVFRSLSFGNKDTAETELLLNKDEVILFFQYLFATYVVEQPVQMQRASAVGGSMMMQPFKRSSDFIGAPHRDDRDAEEYEDEDDDEFEDDSDEEGKVEEAAFQRQGRSNEFYVCPEDLVSQWYRVADQTGTDELNWLEFLHFCLFFKGWLGRKQHLEQLSHEPDVMDLEALEQSIADAASSATIAPAFDPESAARSSAVPDEDVQQALTLLGMSSSEVFFYTPILQQIGLRSFVRRGLLGNEAAVEAALEASKDDPVNAILCVAPPQPY